MNPGSRLISVVIISYNGMEFIDDCLATTIESLKEVDAEILVIDNGSTDGTVEFIREKYKEVILKANDSNLGFAPAANQGFALSKGDFILLLNQDTRIRGDAIFKLAMKMQDNPRIGTIGPKFIGFDGELQLACRGFPRYRDLIYTATGLSRLFPKSRHFARWKMTWFDHLEEREVDQPMGAALMIRQSVLDELGGFDESLRIFFNDVDFCRRVKNAGYINLYYPLAVIEHFYGGTIRKIKPQMVLEWHRALFRYFKKYSRGFGGRFLAYFWGVLLLITSYPRATYHKIRML